MFDRGGLSEDSIADAVGGREKILNVKRFAHLIRTCTYTFIVLSKAFTLEIRSSRDFKLLDDLMDERSL